MQEYASSKIPSLIIESDGDSWFCHDSTFTNIQEDKRVMFGKTPAIALDLFTEKFLKTKNMDKDTLDKVRSIMENDMHVPFYEVKKENCEYNHYEVLRLEIDLEDRMLFRNSSAVDEYVLFSFSEYGPQVRSFSMCREIVGNDYDKRPYKGNYMNIKNIKAIYSALEVLEQGKRLKKSETNISEA